MLSNPYAGPGNHAVVVSGGNGYGSNANNCIRCFSTTELNVGTAITLGTSATAGWTFTINAAGVYAIEYQDIATSGAFTWGISVNSAQLTTAINAITATDRKGASNNLNTSPMSLVVPATLYLQAGDVVRAHTGGEATPGTTDRTRFSIRRIA